MTHIQFTRKMRLPDRLRITIEGEPTVYHVMSRTALEGYPLDDAGKDFFISQVVKLSKLYFAEVFGFCCMGNHFHLLVRMWPGENYSDAELKKRLADFYGELIIPHFSSNVMELVQKIPN